jgi:hypothetical protein
MQTALTMPTRTIPKTGNAPALLLKTFKPTITTKIAGTMYRRERYFELADNGV